MKETWLKDAVDSASPRTKLAVIATICCAPVVLVIAIIWFANGNPFVAIEYQRSEKQVKKCARVASEVSTNENVQERVFGACLKKYWYLPDISLE